MRLRQRLPNSNGLLRESEMRGRYLRAKDVCEIVGISTSALSAWAHDPTHPFPKPINIGTGREGLRWKESEVDRFIADRERARDRQQMARRKILRLAGWA